MTDVITRFIENSSYVLTLLGPIAGVVMIILESVCPMLPLSVFITLNIVSFGSVFGFLISWLATIIGCMLSFFFFRRFCQKGLYTFIKKKEIEQLKKIMKAITDMKLSDLVILIALPFTPAFLVNIAAGLSKIKVEKFFLSIIIGKIVMVYFWDYIGTSLIESLTDVTILVRVVILLIVTFLISKMIEKKWKVR